MANVFDKARQVYQGLKKKVTNPFNDNEGYIRRDPITGGRYWQKNGNIRSPIPDNRLVPYTSTFGGKINTAKMRVLDPFANAQRFIESPTSTAKLFPRFQAPKTGYRGLDVAGKVGVGGANLISTVAGNVVGRGILDHAIDVAQLGTRTAMGKGITDYRNLKSYGGKLAYNTQGYNATPFEVLKNTAGVIDPIFDAYGGGKVFNIGKEAIKQQSKQALKRQVQKTAVQIVKEGAKRGAKYGFVGGVTYGLSDRDNTAKNLQELIIQGTQSGVIGAGVGGVLGGVMAGGGSYLGKVYKDLVDTFKVNNPKATQKEAETAVKTYVRNRLGQFAKKPQKVEYKEVVFPSGNTRKIPIKKEPEFYEQLDNRLGIEGGDALKTATNKIPFGQQAKATGDILEAQAAKKGVQNPTHPFYNINRLNIPEVKKTQLKEKIVGEFRPAFEKVRGKKMSADEIVEQAQVSSDELIRTIGRKRTAELGAAQLRLRQSIAEMVNTGKVNKELLEKMRADIAFSANNARLTQQRGINADPKTPNGRMLQIMLKNILKTEDDIEKIVTESQKYDLNNPKEAALFYRQFVEPTTGDWVDLVRYNSMLTSPNTHIINASSNWQGTGLLLPIQKTIEGGIDSVLSVFNPNRKRTRFAGEGLEYAKGYYGALKPAYQNLRAVLKEEVFGEHPDLYNIPLSKGGPSQKVEHALNVGGRALEAVDQFFKTITKAGLTDSYNYRAKKGVKVKGLEEKIEKEAEKLLFRGDLTEKGAGAVSNAIGEVGKKIRAASYSEFFPVRWAAKLTLPFLKIGTNLAKSGFEHNPITGTLNLIGNEDKIAQVAKITIGSAITALAVPFALDDRLTFDTPTRNTTAGKLAQEAQIPPYSIKPPFTNTWVSYSKMHPAISWNLAMVAALTDAVKYKGVKEENAANIVEGLWSWMKFGLDQTYYKNVADLINGMEGDIGRFAAIPSNYLSQFIPFRAFGSWLNRVIDQYQREPDTNKNFVIQSLQQLAKQIPIASQFVPARTDSQGNPIKKPNTFINLFSPYQTSPEVAPYGDQYRELRETQKGVRGFQKEQEMLKTEETKTAQSFLRTLQQTPPEERKAVFQEFARTNPEVAKEVYNRLMGQQKTGPMEPKEEYLKSQDVAVRSQYILQSLSELKTVEERRRQLALWRQQGIITDDVLKDLMIRLNQQ